MQSGSAMETRRRDGVNMCPHEILLRSNVLMFRWFDRTFIAQLLASLLCDQRDQRDDRGVDAWGLAACGITDRRLVLVPHRESYLPSTRTPQMCKQQITEAGEDARD